VGQVTRDRINEDCDTGERRDRLLQQLEALPQQLAIPQFQPSQIAIGPRQAGDEPLCHQIGSCDPNHNGDGCGHLLDCPCRLDRVRPEDIRRALDQRRGEGRKPLGLPLGIAGVEEDGVALDIAQVPEALPEAMEACPGLSSHLWEAWVQHTDPGYCRSRLRPRGNGRRDDAQRQRDDEPAMS
jgi:hypothetical protein